MLNVRLGFRLKILIHKGNSRIPLLNSHYSIEQYENKKKKTVDKIKPRETINYKRKTKEQQKHCTTTANTNIY